VSRRFNTSEFSLRLILGSRALDHVYRRLDRLRSRLIVAFASDDVLARFNDVAYEGTSLYRPGTSRFREYLFPWEEAVISSHFPRPPGRVVVGGAGGGREAFGLAEMGFEVVAIEPASVLVDAMARRAQDVTGLTVYRGAYEDLPQVFAPESSPESSRGAVDLQSLGTFDAAILGWGSFSYIRTEDHRARTLEAFARVTNGPILVSFIEIRPDSRRHGKRRLAWLDEITRRAGRDPLDRFSIHMGYLHPVSKAEVEALSQRVGLAVLELEFQASETMAPYAVLAPA
jgi:hypothetical protein